MTDGCEQWWERVHDKWVWDAVVCGLGWGELTNTDKDDIRAIYEAAILPQDEDDRELREQAANLTRHPWERGETPQESQ